MAVASLLISFEVLREDWLVSVTKFFLIITTSIGIIPSNTIQMIFTSLNEEGSAIDSTTLINGEFFALL